MKIERIALHGFLSHQDTDWSPDGARLVTLVGPNGAGKSSLLDGVAYALFDAARGKTDDLVQLGATDMSAVVEFSYAGARYRVARGRTTRAGGKSYLELAIEDVAAGDGWRPLTAYSIRETQARIAELLRVDAATFETAVLLMQGRANAFAEATAAERKRILGTVLGLDVYARAETIARERARELEGRTAADRAQLADMERRLVVRPQVQDELARQAAIVTGLEEQLVALDRARQATEQRHREVEAQLAAGAAAEAEAERIRASLEELRERYRRAKERRESAGRMAEMAERTLASAPDVDAAVAELPAARAEVERLEGLEADAIALDERIRAKRDENVAAERDAERLSLAWTADYTATRDRVEELHAAVAALTPVVCEKCGHANVVDQADLRGQLHAAQRRFRELEASRPTVPLSIAREAAALARLEDRRRELAFDRSALISARGALTSVAARAARAEAIEQARGTKDRARVDMTAAIEEMASIDVAGKTALAELGERQAAIAGLAQLRADKAACVEELERQASERRRLGSEHSTAIGAAAAAQSQLEALDQLDEARDALAASISAAGFEAGWLRRLVAAFGVGGIPARIIESVLPELTRYAQELLGTLRPGMSLSIRAQRAKRDGKGLVEALDLVVRDDAGERPLAMFSGGERMSVSLALAVGLSRLVARRAGTALRTLVIDEPDGLDADARRSFGQALRILAHQGELERVVLVSHHEDLAEAGDAMYRVTKNGRGSVVELVA